MVIDPQVQDDLERFVDTPDQPIGDSWQYTDNVYSGAEGIGLNKPKETLTVKENE